jgi:hypothetical protein
MWMRSCAICKGLLHKLRLCDSVRCQCGWIWQGHWSLKAESQPAPPSKLIREEVVMAKVVEFYVPKNFRKPSKRAPELHYGKIIEFCSQTKKSA